MQTSEITVIGTRQVQVTCPICGHRYEYTLRREGSGPDEQTAKQQLAETLNAGCEIVPCPQCGSLSEEMRKERIASQGAGVILSVIGLVICGVVYLIWQWSGRLFYVVGGIGLVFLFAGLAAVFRMGEGKPQQPDCKPKQ